MLLLQKCQYCFNWQHHLVIVQTIKNILANLKKNWLEILLWILTALPTELSLPVGCYNMVTTFKVNLFCFSLLFLDTCTVPVVDIHSERQKELFSHPCICVISLRGNSKYGHFRHTDLALNTAASLTCSQSFYLWKATSEKKDGLKRGSCKGGRI